MTNVTLKPEAKQLYTVQPQKSHSKLSMRKVLYVKLLRWLDKSKTVTILRIMRRTLFALFIFVGVLVPDHIFNSVIYLLSLRSFHALCAVLIYLNFRTIMRYTKRVQRRVPNQHTFHGVPVPELADFLLDEKAFPVQESIRILGMSQPQQKKIADNLEKYGVLIRGDNNARVLQQIDRKTLVRQLSDNFPLEWSQHDKEWVNRRDTFSMYALEQERQERKQEEKVQKRERKLHRLENKIAELNNPFRVRELAYPLETA